MLEHGDILKTWRIDKAPDQVGKEPTPAVRIFDHDLKFLTYEGPVNEGAGHVRITDAGTFETLEESQNQIRIDFYGKILSGEFVLNQIERDQWQFSVLTRRSKP